MEFNEKIDAVLQRKGREVFSVGPRITVYDAVQAMADKDVGALVVMDGSRVIGLFSERDYARKIVLLGKHSKDTLVHEVMSSPASTVTLDEAIDSCMRKMTTLRLRHLVVLDGDRVAGVVSIGDLVNWIISAQDEIIGQLHGYISGSYPA
jgi:CBS domain-containing protein